MENIIIVRLQYKSSEVEMNMLELRTTMTDKIANFGGTFGIWAELTGCSLLGMINLVIISFKLIFRSRNQKQELQCIYLASFHKEYFLSVFYFKRSWYASAYSFGFLPSLLLSLCRPFSSNSLFDAFVNVYYHLVDPVSVSKCQ